jgi:hypothetical protein
MSRDKTTYSLKPTAQKLIAVAFAVCINGLLFLMVDALFAIHLSVSSSTVLS